MMLVEKYEYLFMASHKKPRAVVVGFVSDRFFPPICNRVKIQSIKMRDVLTREAVLSVCLFPEFCILEKQKN